MPASASSERAVAVETEPRPTANGAVPLRRGGASGPVQTYLPVMECVGKSMTSAISMESLNSVSTDSTSNSNSVRTLFVSGLPMDAKPRELYLLFRAYRGYESSLLKMTAKGGKPTSPVGFVTFVTRQDADEARKQLQGVRFDPDCAQVLRLELAKSNTKVSRPKQSPPPHMPLTATAPISAIPQFLAPSLQHDVLLDQHQLLLDQQQQLLALSALPQLSHAHAQALQAAYLPAAAAMQIPQQHAAIYAAAAAAAAAAATPSATNNPPACSTLFVANLAQNVSEDELRSVFKSFPGFTRLRMHTKNGSSVAFVEYSDTRLASQAMLNLQGFQVPSADRGGLRIEYARNKMADVNG